MEEIRNLFTILFNKIVKDLKEKRKYEIKYKYYIYIHTYTYMYTFTVPTRISINLSTLKRTEHLIPYFFLTFLQCKSISCFSMKFKFFSSFYFSFYGADVLLFVVSNE